MIREDYEEQILTLTHKLKEIELELSKKDAALNEAQYQMEKQKDKLTQDI